MFPLRDNIPSMHRPYAVWLIIAVNAVVFFGTVGLSPLRENTLFHLFGIVPARYFDPQWAMWQGYPASGWMPLLTHMFLHSGWLHIIANMWTLWIFGDNIEDVMGPVKFLLFYLLCGLSALFVHMVTSPTSQVPVVGASGAIAGIMGAYFFLYPHAKVVTFLPIIIIPMVFDLPAVFYLGAWFLTQVVSGLLTSPGGAGVAWWAHIGGFVAGMLLLRFFRDDSRCYYCYRSEKFKGWKE